MSTNRSLLADPAWRLHLRQVSSLMLRHPLRYLFLEVSRRCNIACLYCGSDCAKQEIEGELDADEWVGIMKQIAEDFDSSKVMVAVTGGEPLLKPAIFTLFKALHELGFPYGMVTNGTLLTRETAQKLVEAGMGSISVSLDAPSPLNDALRGEGVTRRAEDAIRNLKDAGYKGKLEILSTITRPVVPHLEDMRRYIASLRVPAWRLAPVMPIGRAAKNPALLLDEETLRKILDFVLAHREDEFLPKPEFAEEGFLGEEYEGKVRPFRAQCRAGITVGGIKANGKIGACPELTAAFDQGDIRRERFKDVWENRYRLMRDRSWAKKGDCAACGQFDLCQGGSMHLYPDAESGFLRCFYQMCNSEAFKAAGPSST